MRFKAHWTKANWVAEGEQENDWTGVMTKE